MNHEEIHDDDVPEHGSGDVQKGSNGGDKDWTRGVI
jgi:hypothetical protein